MSVFTTSPHLPLSYFLFPILRFYPPRPVLYTLCYGHCIVSSFTSTPISSSRPLIHITHHDHINSPVFHASLQNISQSPSITLSFPFYISVSLLPSQPLFLSFCTIILVFISTIHFFFPFIIIDHPANPERAVRAMLFCSAGRRPGWHLFPLPFSLLSSSSPLYILSFRLYIVMYVTSLTVNVARIFYSCLRRCWHLYQ